MTPPQVPLHLQLIQMISGYWLSQAIYIAAKLDIAELLTDEAKSCQELAALTQSNPSALYRVMRALAGMGIFSETESQQFILTPLAEHLRADHPRSVKATAIMLGEDPHYPAWGKALHSVKTGEPAFDSVYGMGVFEYFRAHPEAADIFEQSMNSFSLSEVKAILSVYDFSEFKILVDVGGGYGEMLGTLLQKYSHLQGILFDEDYVIAQCQPTLEKHGIVHRCQTVSGSFFASVPPGGDGYLLKHIIHDWDDQRAVTILKNCCEALETNGKVLVMELVVPSGNTPSAAKMLDLNMLVMCAGGQERTQAEFEELFTQAGLKLTRIIPTEEDICLIEGVKI